MLRILCLLILLTLPVFGQKFIVFGDTQFHNHEVFHQMVEKGMGCNPEIVLHVGDMILGYKYPASAGRKEWKVFKKQIAAVTVPFYPAPGNHDITTPGLEEAYLEEWGEHSLFYSIAHPGANFLFLNSTNGEQTDSVTEDQFLWLKETLDSIGTVKPVFITLHAPLHLSQNTSWKRFREVITGYNIQAVFTGHYHVYDRRVIDGIQFFCLVTSGKIPYNQHYAGRSFHFLEVEKVHDHFNFRVHLQDNVLSEEAVPPGEYDVSSPFAPKPFCIDIPQSYTGWHNFTIPFRNSTDSVINYRIEVETNQNEILKLNDAGLTLTPGADGLIEGKVFVEAADWFEIPLTLGNITTEYTNRFGYAGKITAPLMAYTPPGCEVLSKSNQYTFDGVISDAEYNGRTIIGLRSDFQNAQSADSTIIFLNYDNDSLYIGFWGYEPNVAGLEAFAEGKIPLVFSDDDIEFYFDPDRSQRSSYRTMVNSKGVNLNSGPKGLFSFNSESKVHVGDNYWSAEFRIPFSSFLSVPPKAGATWGFNVRRTRTQSEIRISDWSKMSDTPPVELYFFGVAEFK